MIRRSIPPVFLPVLRVVTCNTDNSLASKLLMSFICKPITVSIQPLRLALKILCCNLVTRLRTFAQEIVSHAKLLYNLLICNFIKSKLAHLTSAYLKFQ